jgi:RND family efflux transporter MFP subunit
MIRADLLRWLARWGGRAAILLGFAAGVVVLMLWLAGRFTPKVPGRAGTVGAQASTFEGPVATARLRPQPVRESASGAIRAVHEISIGSKLLARVVDINLKGGQEVKAGEVLVRLDDSDLRARLAQAKAALASAEAVRGQAAKDAERDAKLLAGNAISRQEAEKSATALRSADADDRRAQETVNEVQAMLDFATVRSPIDGTVYDKKVNIGDMVTPGQILLTLFDPKRMQLVASVRESLASQLRAGQSIGVRVDALDKECSGTVSEIVPESQSGSHAFQVKVTGPCPAGIYSGMFGRILIPLKQQEEVLLIPRQAVRNVGQLELVKVVENGQATQRAVRTGRKFGEDVEVLSGLREGEEVVMPVPPAPAEVP